MSLNNTVKCFFCDDSSARYSCPQCGLKYCSVNCYQHPKHLQCSEEFYKTQVTTELKQLKASPEEKKRLIDYLVKNSNIENETQKLTNRFDGIDLDDSEKLWQALSQDEKEMFQRKVETGDLDFVEPWIPWWSTDPDDMSKKHSRCPKIIQNIPTMKSLLGNEVPNENLKNSIIEVLLTYCCVQRLYIGDFYDAPEECLDTIISLSDVLNTNRVYDVVPQLLHIFCDKVDHDQNIDVTSLSCIADTAEILKIKNGTMRALSDLHDYFKKCCKHYKRENKELSKKIYVMEKKIYFFIGYANEYLMENIDLCKILNSFYEQKTITTNLFDENSESVRNYIQINKKKENMIEELN